MKKTMIVVALLLLVVISASSFEVSVGIKAGPAIALGAGGPKPNDFVSAQMGFAWSAGIAVDLGFAEIFAVELNVLYAAMYKFGYNADPAINGIGISQQTLSVQAIEVPVIAKLRLGKGSGKWTLGVGPDFFFLLGGEPRTYINDAQIGSPLAYENNVLYGLVGAVGYQLPVGKAGSISFELRYTKPLTYFYSAAYNPQGSDSGYQRFDLVFGYYFF